MDKMPYKDAQIGPCSEWSQTNKAWKPVAVVSYFTSGERIDKQIHSDEYSSTFEEANEHVVKVARRWVDEKL